MTAAPEPIDIDWDATEAKPGAGKWPATWDHKAWPEGGAA